MASQEHGGSTRRFLVRNKPECYNFNQILAGRNKIEIRDIKKELILDKIKKVSGAKGNVRAWEVLGKKVSAQWDCLSAIHEIIQQREKTRDKA